VQFEGRIFEVDVKAQRYAIEAHELDEGGNVFAFVADVTVSPMFNLAGKVVHKPSQLKLIRVNAPLLPDTLWLRVLFPR
jgi:hypothetical protein